MDGIGLRQWEFAVPGNPTHTCWRYLVEDVMGREAHGSSEGRHAWVLSPDYQRGPVWTMDQQERFIGHVLAGGVVPPIYVQRHEKADHAPVAEYWDLPCEVIDGQQRLRAICSFVEGKIGAQVYHGGEWHHYTWAQMSKPERRSMNVSSRITFVDLSREDRLRFYLRLNGAGVAHSEEELDKVRRMLAEEFSDKPGE